MSCGAYRVEAQWGRRADTAAGLADRFARTVDAMRALDPRLDNWLWGDAEEIWDTEGKTAGRPFATVRANLVAAIEKNPCKGGDRISDPSNGYWMMILTPSAAATAFSLAVSAGEDRAGSKSVAFKHYVSFKIERDLNHALATYDVCRALVLLISEIWETTWAEAAPDDNRPLWLGFPVRATWMSYVSPCFAPLITPPADAIVERRPNGGLFLAATDETFETANPAHMAAAGAIEAALQPLNKIAWPIDDPYR